jgi:hypothetical protein
MSGGERLGRRVGGAAPPELACHRDRDYYLGGDQLQEVQQAPSRQEDEW